MYHPNESYQPRRMNAIETILANLAALQGEDSVKEACKRFVKGKFPVALDSSIASLSDAESSISSSAPKKRGRPAKGAAATAAAEKPKKEYKPRGQTSWNKLVEEVLKELRATYAEEHPDADEAAIAKAVPYKIAYEEAGKRKRASDPEAQRKYEEKKAAKLAAKITKLPPLPPSGKTSQTMHTAVSEADDE